MTKVGTIDKALALLTLFSPEEPQWTVEAAAQRIGVPTSTAYRYFRSLAEAGLIVGFTAGRYVIGPGVIELDRLARRADPLIVAGAAPMDRLATLSPERCVVLLSRFYRHRVMCVDQRAHGPSELVLSFERGRPMPLYRGCVSKVILAHLPARTVARLYKEDHEAIARANFGHDLRSFRENLRAIRRDGYSVTRNEVDLGVVGIGAAIFSPEGEAFASLSLVIPEIPELLNDIEVLTERVVEAAAAISGALRVLDDSHGKTAAASSDSGAARDPRHTPSTSSSAAA